MLEIFVKVFPVIWVCLVAFIIYSWMIYFKTKEAERKAYERMISNPTDSTVLEYIAAFKHSDNFATRMASSGSQYGAKHREDKQRQAQGYEIINNSSAVSSQAKEQLKNVFLVKGVPIKL